MPVTPRYRHSDKVSVRIGIHAGDVIHKDDDVYGDAVNTASRVEPLASAGEICVTEQVYDQVHNKIPFKLIKLQSRKDGELRERVVYRVDESHRFDCDVLLSRERAGEGFEGDVRLHLGARSLS